jgi:hypothetical protein
MKIPLNGTLFLVLLPLKMLSAAPALAQQPARRSIPILGAPEVPALHPKGSDPKPVDAEGTILAAFDKYEVVGISAAHGNKDLDDFLLHLTRNPAFPNKVNDVVVECGNSLYQPTLDRYIAGGDFLGQGLHGRTPTKSGNHGRRSNYRRGQSGKSFRA